MKTSAVVAFRRLAKVPFLIPGWFSRCQPGDVVVLLYHRVGVGNNEIDLPVDQFESQLRILADRHQVVSMDTAWSSPGGGVILSFDDGSRDFYDHVLPLLQRYNLPAMLYLATSFVAVRDQLPGALTWGHLESIVDTGLVSVGAHTHTHANLLSATREEAREEMLLSKSLIERFLGIECDHFSYPWSVGSRDADMEARALFKTAALHAWRINRRDRTDLHQLGRIPVLRSDGEFLFKAKVSGLLNGEAHLYRLFRRGPWRYR